jgi:hypothetical protein
MNEYYHEATPFLCLILGVTLIGAGWALSALGMRRWPGLCYLGSGTLVFLTLIFTVQSDLVDVTSGRGLGYGALFSIHLALGLIVLVISN